MRAVWIHEQGAPEVMRVEESATPEPGAGEALIRVAASGVNFHDVNQRSGHSPTKITLPLIVGNEGAGTVERLGPGADGVRVGDRVAWVMHQGTYTTHAVVPAEILAPIPDGIESRIAAATLMQGLMAHGLTHESYAVKSGDVCLVQSAASGIGGLICQIAKLRGARVIGTVSTREKVAPARANGADEVIVRGEADVAAAVRRFTEGDGVHVVYDGVGDTVMGGLDSLRPRGTMVIYGAASGSVPLLNTTELSKRGGLYVTRAVLRHFVFDRASLLERAGTLFEWIAAGKLLIRISAGYPLEQAAKAHADIASGKAIGKIVIDIA